MTTAPKGRVLRPAPGLPSARPTSPEASALADQIIESIGAAPPPEERRYLYAFTEDGERVTSYSNQPVEVVVHQLERKKRISITQVREGRSGPFIQSNVIERRTRERPSEQHLISICGASVPPDDDGGSNLDPRKDVSLPHHPYTPGMPPQARRSHQLAASNQAYPASVLQARMASLRLSDRVPTFLAFLKHKKCSRSVVIDSVWTYRIFMELIGDKELEGLSPEDCDIFLNALSVWPAHASKRREFRNMRAPEVIAKAQRLHRAPLNLRTQQKHIDRLRAFFHWLEKRGEITPGLLRGVKLYQRNQDFGRPRAPFTEEELLWMFDVHRREEIKTPYQYWAPIIGLYQGMRVNEIGQLYVDDVVNPGGMWCIDVTRDRPGQRLKNKMSRRLLPIHPVILQCGFLDFVEQARRWGRITLFPDVIWGSNGPGDCISDWFNRTFLRKRCGIVHPSLTFHSFRHCFASIGDRSDVRHDRLALLLGHTAGQSVLRDHYIKVCGPRELEVDLQAIKFPHIEHDRYEPSRFDHAFETASMHEQRLAKLDAVYGPRKK
jgi:integrase